MPTQRLEEKRVEECMGEGESERERKSHARKRKREGERASKQGFVSSFYMFFPPPGPALCKLGLARSAVCSYLKSSLWSSDLLLFYFRRLFPSLSFITQRARCMEKCLEIYIADCCPRGTFLQGFSRRMYSESIGEFLFLYESRKNQPSLPVISWLCLCACQGLSVESALGHRWV